MMLIIWAQMTLSRSSGMVLKQAHIESPEGWEIQIAGPHPHGGDFRTRRVGTEHFYV